MIKQEINILDKFDEFNVDDAVVWVDPLDGTAQFVIDNLSAVTVLIGLSVKGESKIGVVHFPYSSNDAQSAVPMTLFGTREHGAYIIKDGSKAPQLMDPFPEALEE